MFPADYYRILSRINSIDPVAYSRTRNHTDGAVTRLSAYLSRGVISTADVMESLIQRGFSFDDTSALLKELAWRDYFQRVWQVRDVHQDLRSTASAKIAGIPAGILNAATGINAVDHAIREMYRTGYMHNHCRLYTAAIACNFASFGWQDPARWMYYHLLDGDWASNACSWQWTAGTFSSKPYFANQENINMFTGSEQRSTWLDVPYESLADVVCPDAARRPEPLELQAELPVFPLPEIDPALPVCIYNYYNLDPNWRTDRPHNRILLLEPEHFRRYPVSSQCVEFMFRLASNIPGLMFFTGSWDELDEILSADYGAPAVYYKEHPLNRHYHGTADDRGWLDPDIEGFFPSFSAYWKKIEPGLRQAFRINSLIRA